uniref:Uncharacterized protein n=1 Tax=Anguilla anguilla TaxID=7936 RepID=A0A0E9VZB0_ANGAN
MRAEGSRFPLMRLVSSTFTDEDSVISQQISLLWKSRGSRHSSRPSKINTTLTSSPFNTSDLFHL